MQDTIKKFNKVFDYIGSVLSNRQQEISALKLALITKQHLLLIGPPGTAKTKLAHLFFSMLSSGSVFSAQFDKWMGPDDVFGPIDIKAYREEYKLKRSMKGMAPTANFIFADELLDANPSLLRAMLGILNERRLVKSGMEVFCPLHTCIATTNFSDNSESLSAVLDRFLFRVEVSPVPQGEERVLMIKRSMGEAKTKVPAKISCDDIRSLSRAVKDIGIKDETITLLERSASTYQAKVGKRGSKFTDRRLVQCVDVVKANALLLGRESVMSDDLSVLSFVFGIANNVEDMVAATSAISGVISAENQIKELLKKINDLREEVDSVLEDVNLLDLSKMSLNKLSDISTKLENAQTTLTGYERTFSSTITRLSLPYGSYIDVSEEIRSFGEDLSAGLASLTDILIDKKRKEDARLGTSTSTGGMFTS
jgi:MoxR-like ATPase